MNVECAPIPNNRETLDLLLAVNHPEGVSPDVPKKDRSMTIPVPMSVVMPNFNGERDLPEAIESILGQSFRAYEFVIVDDFSSDDSWNIIRAFAGKDSRIIPLRNGDNKGISETLNNGLIRSRGKYIVRMDSDDVALPNRLRRLFDYMEDPGHGQVGVCGSYCLVIDAAGKPLGTKTFPLDDREIRHSFWRRNPIQHSASIIRRSCFDDCGFYDGRLVLAEDLDLWMRFGQKYELANIPEVLLKYRISDRSSIIAQQKKMLERSIRVRLDAAKKYGYRLTARARLSLAMTWLMRYLPPRIVLKIFMRSIHVKP